MRLAEERGLFRSIDYGPDAFPPENNICVDPSLELPPAPDPQPAAQGPRSLPGSRGRDSRSARRDGRRSAGERVELPAIVISTSTKSTSPPRFGTYRAGWPWWTSKAQTIVSNGTSHYFGDSQSIAAGCVLEVEFEYVCQQTPGVYFLNAGVMTSAAGGTGDLCASDCGRNAHRRSTCACRTCGGAPSRDLTERPRGVIARHERWRAGHPARSGVLNRLLAGWWSNVV